MTGSNSVKNYIIKNYNLHFGVKISEESALQDVVAYCVDNAFEVCVRGRAGEDYGIYEYTEDIMRAKQLAVRGIVQFLTAESFTNNWFKSLLEEIVDGCFSGYNRERANAQDGRKVGFTYGNAQCLISVSMAHIMACFSVCGINKYNERLKKYWLPVDESFYDYINKILREYPDDAFCDNKLVSHIFSELHWSEITSLELCLRFVCMAELLLESAIRFEEGAGGKLK